MHLWINGLRGAREASDIDGRLFIDGELVPQNVYLSTPNDIGIRLLKRIFPSSYPGHANAQLKDETEYARMFQGSLKEKLGLTDNQFQDVAIVPLSRKIIDAYINDLLRPDYNIPDRSLVIMFNLAIGRGIEKYRRHLIERLSQLGPKGEEIWRLIISKTKVREEKLYTPFDINQFRIHLYPLTLAEAKKLYAR